MGIITSIITAQTPKLRQSTNILTIIEKKDQLGGGGIITKKPKKAK